MPSVPQVTFANQSLPKLEASNARTSAFVENPTTSAPPPGQSFVTPPQHANPAAYGVDLTKETGVFEGIVIKNQVIVGDSGPQVNNIQDLVQHIDEIDHRHANTTILRNVFRPSLPNTF